MTTYAQQPGEGDAEWLARLEALGRGKLTGLERFVAYGHEQVARRQADRGRRDAEARGQAESEEHDRDEAEGLQATAGPTPLAAAKDAYRKLSAEQRQQFIAWQAGG